MRIVSVPDSFVENKVVVKIFGDEYPITGSGDPAYISKIADFVDSRMQEVAKGSRVGTRDKIAILTALSLASELFERSETMERIASERDSNVDNLLSQLEAALTDDKAVRQ
ncbi:MAG: hypothetical protein DRP45_00715 [Candidatus Zixiibacteriota bacterium]|nr:MAG: hypothetical protein DRP45_00715 [candidate division Zixibacteria bacterium]